MAVTLQNEWGEKSCWDLRAFETLYDEPSRNGIYKTLQFQGRGTRIVNMGEMFGYEFISDQEMSRVTLTRTESLSNALKDGDLLFGRRSVVPAGAGKCSLVVEPPEPLTFESSIIRVRLKQEEAIPCFYYYFFASQVGRSAMSSIVSGTNIKGIRASELKELKVPIPPVVEQEVIAEMLRDADALIGSLEQLIAKKRLVKQGAMQELLTGKRRLHGFGDPSVAYKQTEVGVIPGDWRLDPVEEIAHIKTGSRNTQDRVDDGAYPFFVRSQTVERINSYSFDGEAVLTAGDGVGTGKVFHYINGKFDLHQRVYRISDFSEDVSGYFFYLYFSSCFYGRIMQMTAKSSVDSVRREMIARMLIPLPQTKAEQEAIAKTVSDMDSEIVALELKLVKARQLKQGMMQNLLTGKIRLV